MNIYNNQNTNKLSNSKGFSLIEVLIAIVVFSFGLLGIAGLMTVSIRSNHNGYLRSQAIIASNNISSKMRANVAGLWAGKYIGTTASMTAVNCDSTNHCDRGQLAAYDLYQWGLMLAQMLPSGVGDIRCETPSLPFGILSSGLWEATPPFKGTCIIRITWKELSESSVGDQTNIMVLQP